jgi:hypothetical protein
MLVRQSRRMALAISRHDNPVGRLVPDGRLGNAIEA